MTAMAMPADAIPDDSAQKPFTVDDLEAAPNDGRRYELIDGVLYVSPAPILDHQQVVLMLAMALELACPRDLLVVIAPFEWRASEHTSLQPDVLVARRDDLLAVEGRKYLLNAPVLAVEVLSPSTRRNDRMNKLSVYQDEGVTSYWLVDPDLDQPSLTALELVDDRYVEVAKLVGTDSWTADSPFRVDLCPDDLVAKLRS